MIKARKILSLFIVIMMMFGMTSYVSAANNYTTWTVYFIDATTSQALEQTVIYKPTQSMADKMNKYSNSVDLPISSLNRYSEDGSQITPPADYEFEGYATATVCPNGTIEIKVKPKTVKHEIKLITEGNGSVSGGGSIEANKSVTVTAASTANSHFVKWTENGTEVSTDASYTFTVTEARTLTAVFEDCQWSEWTSNGNNTHSRTCKICDKEQTNDCSGGHGDCLNKPTCDVCGEKYADKGDHTFGTLIPKEDSTYETKGMEAHYKCELCEELFDEDKNPTTKRALEIPRVPKLDWELIFWDTDKDQQIPSSYTTITIPEKLAESLANKDLIWNGTKADVPFNYLNFDMDKLPEDYQLTVTYPGNTPKGATFTNTSITIYIEKITYEVKVNTETEEWGSVTGSGTYEIKSDATVTAVPKPGYHFVKWMENGAEVSRDANYTFTVTGARTLTAVFEACDWNEWISNGDDTHTRTCSICNATETKECYGGTATCSQKAECEVCGGEYGDFDTDNHTADLSKWDFDQNGHWNPCECGEKLNMTEHDFQWVVDKEATATEKGSKHEECTVCKYKKAAVKIPATGSTDPSKPEEGDKDNNTENGDSSKPEESDKDNSTQTGDDFNAALPISLAIVALAGIGGVAATRRRHN